MVCETHFVVLLRLVVSCIERTERDHWRICYNETWKLSNVERQSLPQSPLVSRRLKI